MDADIEAKTMATLTELQALEIHEGSRYDSYDYSVQTVGLDRGPSDISMEACHSTVSTCCLMF